MSAPTEAEVAYAGVLGQAALLRDGRLTSIALVDLLLNRIARLDGRLQAFRMVFAEEARAAAAAADAARQNGDQRPLLGVPIAVKDNVDVRGHSSMFGTGSPEPAAADDDELVARLRAAGLILIGKTHLPELALWAATESQTHGITRNPWDLNRAPGGSSGGSAVAVAAGMVPAAHATDGLGSIRIPASACGLVGLKPTYGAVPAPDHWNGLSHAGFLTRSVADTAALLDAVAGDGDDGLTAAIAAGPGSPLRIATSTAAATPVRPVHDVRDAMARASSILRHLGYDAVKRRPPYGSRLSMSTTVRYLDGMAQELAGLADSSQTERRTRRLARLGRRLPDGAVPWAMREGEEFGRRMARFFDDVDVLVTPTMPVLPRRAGCLTDRGLTRTINLMLPCAAYTAPWNGCGLPALSLPIGTTKGGLPVGIQLIAPAGEEGRLLALAAAIEPIAGWLDRRVDEGALAAPLP
ncbi:MAG TPA: amidase family protein [Mycobacteriales bacterium]|nr:amidase family protein [Mycobacteriales bacterium]